MSVLTILHVCFDDLWRHENSNLFYSFLGIDVLRNATKYICLNYVQIPSKSVKNTINIDQIKY